MFENQFFFSGQNIRFFLQKIAPGLEPCLPNNDVTLLDIVPRMLCFRYKTLLKFVSSTIIRLEKILKKVVTGRVKPV